MLAANYMTAEQLGLRDDQRDALIQTLNFLEKERPPEAVIGYDVCYNVNAKHVLPEDIKFNMAVWTAREHHSPGCGTIVCLGGTTEVLSGLNLARVAEDLMGIGSWGLFDLFFGTLNGLTFCEWELHDFTLDQAIAATRNYLVTGKPSWKEVRADVNV